MGCSQSNNQQNNPNLNFNNRNRYKSSDEYAYKVVILGDVYVGKTSILENYLSQNNTDETYQTTVGIAFSQKVVTIDENTAINLQLWDTSGQDIYRDLISLYYRDANAAILVFDYSNQKSVEGLKYWIEQLDERISTNDVVIKVVGNKYDLFQKESEEKKAEKMEFIQEALSKISNNHYEVVNTSAKTGMNVNYLFEKVAKNCFEKFGAVSS